jgi:heptosyltransferase-1
VFDDLQGRGLALRLLAGNDTEQARAQALIRGRSGAEVLPRMGLRSVAEHLARARIMVGLDSGLTHLSAGLGRPTIGIYRASTPVRTPLQGPAYVASLGERGQAPDAARVRAAVAEALDDARDGAARQAVG